MKKIVLFVMILLPMLALASVTDNDRIIIGNANSSMNSNDFSQVVLKRHTNVFNDDQRSSYDVAYRFGAIRSGDDTIQELYVGSQPDFQSYCSDDEIEVDNVLTLTFDRNGKTYQATTNDIPGYFCGLDGHQPTPNRLSIMIRGSSAYIFLYNQQYSSQPIFQQTVQLNAVQK